MWCRVIRLNSQTSAGSYWFHLQDRRVRQETSETSDCCLLIIFFNHEDGGSTSLRKSDNFYGLHGVTSQNTVNILQTFIFLPIIFETLCYKPEGRGFEFRLCHWIFQLT
jgi:hypothetical protein